MHKKTSRFFPLLLSGILIACIGCSNKVNVTGTVTFEDGNPLTVGSVIFENDAEQFFGNLNSQGQFTLGSIKQGDGIPSGTYKVRLSGTEQIIEENGDRTSVKLVDDKFNHVATSGLTADVGKQRAFEFKVMKPTSP